MICKRCEYNLVTGCPYCRNCGFLTPSPENLTTLQRIQREESFPVLWIPGDRFALLEFKGCGAIGTVYRAYDFELDEMIALKILKPDFADSEESIVRFKSEIKIARRIKHPNICASYDFIALNNHTCISMEYLEGILLSDLIEEGGLTDRNRYNITLGISLGLKAAHDMGIIHRDLKPDNIMITDQSLPVIMDFGVAGYVNPKAVTEETLYGTPLYWTPEHLTGGQKDHRSDIYSLGIICYEMVTGKPPFTSEDIMQLALKHANESVIPPSETNPDIEPGMERCILKCLEKDPSSRYASVDMLIEDLRSCAPDRSITDEHSDRYRILVVDDEAKVRRMLNKFLAMNGFEVIMAENGEIGVEKAMNEQPDLILMDLMMPLMDGCRAAEIIGSHLPTKHIPILLLTSIVSDEYKSYSRAIGIREYLNKPFNLSDLLEKIQFHLSLAIV
jgi:serine/threonine protein kinase